MSARPDHRRTHRDLVNISSIGAHLTFPNHAVHGATKAALTHLSETLRQA